MDDSVINYQQSLDFKINSLTNLPPPILALLKELPPQAKDVFLHEYESNKKSILISYLIHILPPFPFSFTYAYLGKWNKQIAYWLTFGGFGFWFLANIFRIPGMVKRFNNELSDSILKSLLISYPRNKNFGIDQPTKRQLSKHTDLSNLNVLDLADGYLFDYEAKTWKVSLTRQFDWNDGTIEKQHKIVSDMEKAVLFVSVEGEPSVYFTNSLNVHRIDEPLEELILNGQRPPAAITFKNEKYFRESSDEGFGFYADVANRIKKWIYFDVTQSQLIRLELEDKDLAAYIGKQIRPSSIQDILPPSR